MQRSNEIESNAVHDAIYIGRGITVRVIVDHHALVYKVTETYGSEVNFRLLMERAMRDQE